MNNINTIKAFMEAVKTVEQNENLTRSYSAVRNKLAEMTKNGLKSIEHSIKEGDLACNTGSYHLLGTAKCASNKLGNARSQQQIFEAVQWFIREMNRVIDILVESEEEAQQVEEILPVLMEAFNSDKTYSPTGLHTQVLAPKGLRYSEAVIIAACEKLVRMAKVQRAEDSEGVHSLYTSKVVVERVECAKNIVDVAEGEGFKVLNVEHSEIRGVDYWRVSGAGFSELFAATDPLNLVRNTFYFKAKDSLKADIETHLELNAGETMTATKITHDLQQKARELGLKPCTRKMVGLVLDMIEDDKESPIKHSAGWCDTVYWYPMTEKQITEFVEELQPVVDSLEAQHHIETQCGIGNTASLLDWDTIKDIKKDSYDVCMRFYWVVINGQCVYTKQQLEAVQKGRTLPKVGDLINIDRDVERTLTGEIELTEGHTYKVEKVKGAYFTVKSDLDKLITVPYKAPYWELVKG